jgi:hypothetical protein
MFIKTLTSVSLWTIAALLFSMTSCNNGLCEALSTAKTALLMPIHKVITAQTSQGTVTGLPGSLVFFMDNSREVAYYNVNAQHKGDVKIHVGKLEITILPGEVVMITPDASATFEDANLGKGISTRRHKLEHEGDGVKVFTADFSIPAAIMNVRPLSEMLHSKDPYQRHLMHEVLKNAAIWQDTAAVDGVYEPSK